MDGGAGTATAVAIRPACAWCETEFEPRKGGSPQRFCATKCRDAFHSAGRRFACRVVLSGRLTVAELRGDPHEACMLGFGEERPAAERRQGAPEVEVQELVLSEAQRLSVRKLEL